MRTGAPLVAGRNVIFGVSGGDRGVRGHVTAFDIKTGQVRWRYRNLGPNEDVGIGPRFQPYRNNYCASVLARDATTGALSGPTTSRRPPDARAGSGQQPADQRGRHGAVP